MPDPMIKAGSIFIEDGTVLPGSMVLERKPFSPNWRLAQGLDVCGLEAQIGKAGWTSFFMAGEIRTIGFGFNAIRRVRAAVEKVIENVHSQKCNCLEITRLVAKSFLGIPYVSVGAHARHLQDGPQFRGR